MGLLLFKKIYPPTHAYIYKQIHTPTHAYTSLNCPRPSSYGTWSTAWPQINPSIWLRTRNTEFALTIERIRSKLSLIGDDGLLRSQRLIEGGLIPQPHPHPRKHDYDRYCDQSHNRSVHRLQIDIYLQRRINGFRPNLIGQDLSSIE